MSPREMEPEQLIATTSEWLDGWIEEELSGLACGSCHTALVEPRLTITSDRAWDARLQIFMWLHVVQVTCTVCASVSRFDAEAIRRRAFSQTSPSERARPTDPAPTD